MAKDNELVICLTDKMNQKLAKKVRKQFRRNMKETLATAKAKRFRVRLVLAWWLLFGRKGG